MSYKKVVFINLYNPGAIGPRYVASAVKNAGHEVFFIHFKGYLAASISTEDAQKVDFLKRGNNDIQYVTLQQPGEVVFSPYPTPIYDLEYDLLIQEIKKIKPDIICISVYTVSVEMVKKITGLIHNNIDNTPIVWGGVHCIIAPEGCFIGHDSEDDSIKKRVPDIVCDSEGESPIVEFLKKEIIDIKEAVNINGLRVLKDGVIYNNGERNFEKDLDKLSFPLYAHNEILIEDNKVDRDKYNSRYGIIKHNIVMISSRGCPYKCSYCVYSIINKIKKVKVRRRSSENIIKEVEALYHQFGVKHIHFYDEIFACDENFVLEFCEKWTERLKPYGITFDGYAHFLLTNGEMVKTLFESGMSMIGIGVQSGSEKIVTDIYDRGFNRGRIIDLSKIISQYPFKHVQVDILYDSPYENENDKRQTLELLLDMYPPFVTKPIGLVIYEHSQLFNKKKLTEGVDWNGNLFWNCLYLLSGTKKLKKETILEISNNVYFRENPLELEKMVIDIRRDAFPENMGLIRLSLDMVKNPYSHPTFNLIDQYMRDNKRYRWNRFKSDIKKILKKCGCGFLLRAAKRTANYFGHLT